MDSLTSDEVLSPLDVIDESEGEFSSGGHRCRGEGSLCSLKVQSHAVLVLPVGRIAKRHRHELPVIATKRSESSLHPPAGLDNRFTNAHQVWVPMSKEGEWTLSCVISAQFETFH